MNNDDDCLLTLIFIVLKHSCKAFGLIHG